MVDGTTMMIRTVGALVAVLLLAWGGARLLRGSPIAAGTARQGRRLRLEEAMALDPRRRLLLVSCDGREMLVLTGGTGPDVMLGWVPPQTTVREPPA